MRYFSLSNYVLSEGVCFANNARLILLWYWSFLLAWVGSITFPLLPAFWLRRDEDQQSCARALPLRVDKRHCNVNSVNVVVSCPCVSNNDSSWENMISYYLFQHSCISASNHFHLTMTRVSFQYSNDPLPTPEPSPMILPVKVMWFVNFDVRRLSIHIETS